jgi:osmoprotectant transport system permease protein
VELITSVVSWLADPTHWQGVDGIPARMAEHLQISLLSIVVAALIALPLGLLVGHTGRGGFAVLSIANIGRAVPSYAILVIVLPISLQAGLGLSFVPTFVAMTALAVPPILTNAYVGVQEVDRDLLEGARGMGMRGIQVLRRVELPLALPLMLTGLRTASVQVVATATLGAVIGLGGLGRYIVDGIARRENDRLFAGALLVALLAIAVDQLIAFLGRRSAPRPPAQDQDAEPPAFGPPQQTPGA